MCLSVLNEFNVLVCMCMMYLNNVVAWKYNGKTAVTITNKQKTC